MSTFLLCPAFFLRAFLPFLRYDIAVRKVVTAIMALYQRALYYTVSDGSKIYCMETGNPRGFPVVLLHGNAMDGSYFQSAVKILTSPYRSSRQNQDPSHCRYLLIDSREHGKSISGRSGTKASPKLNFVLMAQDLEDVLQQLEIKKCILAGHSDGANLAMVYASRYPARVGGLLLNSGNLNVKDLKWYVRAAIHARYTALCALSILFHPCRRMAAVTGLMLHDLPVTKAQLAGIDVPVWVLTGEHDIIGRAATEQLAQLFPHCRLIIHKNAGHDLPIQDPAFFAGLIQHLVREIA